MHAQREERCDKIRGNQKNLLRFGEVFDPTAKSGSEKKASEQDSTVKFTKK
jgi:hypothetical protein